MILSEKDVALATFKAIAQKKRFEDNPLSGEYLDQVLAGQKKAVEAKRIPIMAEGTLFDSLTAASAHHGITVSGGYGRINNPNYPDWYKAKQIE